MYGAGANGAANPQPFALCAIAHLSQFLDGLVVGLALADTAHREPHESTDDHHNESRELAVGFHGSPFPLVYRENEVVLW